jgi:hypothetical protein
MRGSETDGELMMVLDATFLRGTACMLVLHRMGLFYVRVNLAWAPWYFLRAFWLVRLELVLRHVVGPVEQLTSLSTQVCLGIQDHDYPLFDLGITWKIVLTIPRVT